MLTLPERFWRRVHKTDSCWLWTGGCFHFGHGAYWHEGGNRRAHRIAWLGLHGEIPIGLDVLHRCDVPSCVNPEHLFLGTQADNNADMVDKGRQYRPTGNRHHNRKIDFLTAENIRAALANGEVAAVLARRYGIHPNTVYSIKAGRSWTAPC